MKYAFPPLPHRRYAVVDAILFFYKMRFGMNNYTFRAVKNIDNKNQQNRNAKPAEYLSWCAEKALPWLNIP